jgi:hypothetical protein
MATTSIAEPIQQAVIRHMVNGDEPFRFILFTDGSGKLVDINYDETLDISHDLDLPSLAARTTLVLTPVRPLTNVDYEQTDLDENEIETDDTPTLFDAISNLFLDCNDSLENPVGDPPEDDEPTVENGTFEDFNKALAAVAYLAHIHGLEGSFQFSANEETFEYDEGDNELADIVSTIANGFDVRGCTYEYIDQNDGRVTSHAGYAPSYHVDQDDVASWFPSARERLECKTWLRDLFVTMGMDVAEIDKAFPVKQG